MWDAFKDFIFWGMDVAYGFIGDWGMAIIVVTLLFRLILFPFMQKQIKSSYEMSKLQPLMTEMQEKYKDDPERMQEEMSRIYRETKFNPIAGCLPLFLQMPIFVAVFQVLQEMDWRTSGSNYNFYNIISNLTVTPSGALEQGFMPFIPYLIILILFACLTFLPMVIQQWNSDSQQRNQMMIMSAVMTIMMLFIGWSSPAGVLLFWATSSLFGVLQQQFTQTIMKKEDTEKEEELIPEEPVKVEYVRREKKKRPTKHR
ncbi:MAG: YidC/Oxa1 family membrane protein insertase [Eggerthellaceae bacterium]|jgi:YidC/Oxa1 family membrane protein insertase